MHFRLRILLTQFTLRDLLWLTVVIGLVVVWRSDLVTQEVIYRDMLRFRMGDSSRDVNIVLQVAHQHPELLTELKAFDAEKGKHMSQTVALNRRFYDLVEKARTLYRRDKESGRITFLGDNQPAADPFADGSIPGVNK